jgi:hypothetical protein
MKRICAITMVRNDAFFLRKWTAYYGAQLGEENLYVYLDGKDQPLPDWCPKAHIIPCDRVCGQVVRADKGRIRFLSARAAELLESYDLVIGTDADEILAVDPKLGVGLREFLSGLDIRSSVSGLGIDVGQILGEEGDITPDRPFLSQRSTGQVSTRYTKASVLARPLRWGSGFHRVKGHNFHIAKDLYLFHFGYFDMRRIEMRFSDKDRMEAGWEKHLHRRSETIRNCTEGRKRDWDRTVRWTRVAEQVLRPPYAWNKPGLLEMKVIVRIPDRFRETV